MQLPMSRPQARPPSVESVLSQLRPSLEPGTDLVAVTAMVREAVAVERARLGVGDAATSAVELARVVREHLDALVAPAGAGLTPVINGSGVIIHTNLGRAVWPQAAIEAAARAASEPVLLELDRDTGRRGRRYRHAEEHLIALTGAEDALITNNNAAALALAVGLARRRGVLVSRGELVEIGGGVRIPDIVRRAGARLIEVGTTNRTRVDDYGAALAEGRAAMILRIHPSNFRQDGFVETPDPVALAALAKALDIPLIDDLGSGALIDTAAFGLLPEPTARERLESGADIVTFSGDKLLGGPQAGFIAGRADLVARMRRDPLARAVRPDKVTLAAVAATLAIYRAGRATLDIPVWRAIAADVTSLRTRAVALESRLGGDVEVIETEATVGGGALPGEILPSIGLRFRPRSAARLMAALRQGEPCVVARIERGSVIVDLRAVMSTQDEALAHALERALA
jgi:L-seryl-tRNA(Ser) seleniumtransferase